MDGLECFKGGRALASRSELRGMSMVISQENLPPGVPAEAVPHLLNVGYFQESPLRVGDSTPSLPLFTPNGEVTEFSTLYRDKPAVLVFGSFT
jgi:hypothetical protein